MNEQIEAIRAEIERLQEIHERNLKKPMERGRIGFAHGVVECCDRILSFIDSLPEETAPKGYDEAYLNECIAKASKTWEGVDVDKYMDEVRGNCPKLSDNLEEAAEKYAKQYAKETKPKDADGEIWKVGDVMIENQMSFEDGFKAGAQWMAGQGVILNLSIDEFSCGAYNACVEQGLTSEDDVIVQIRKAKEGYKMKWHKPTELPDGDMEVLAHYGNFTYANYVVLKYDNGYWWQHLPPMPPVIPDGGWFGIDESAILRWAYIKED